MIMVLMPDFKLTKRDAWLGLALAVVTLLLYWQVRDSEFVSLDDGDYVYNNLHVNTGLSWKNVVWAFTQGHASNWHPLTWISLMLDCQMFGMNSAAIHLVNVLLHIAASLLLFVFLRRVTGDFWRCALAAALFAWHPAHVESVAWVSERKDVLSAVFFMLTLLTYHRYVLKPGTGNYLLTLFLFALGLMAKPMLVTLPCLLLLLDIWPFKRVFFNKQAQPVKNAPVPLRRIILEKIPFLILSLVSCRITYVVQAAGGSTDALGIMSLRLRLSNAAISYCSYLGKIFWPSNLAAFYPYDMSPNTVTVVAGLLLLALITIATLWQFKKFPFLATGWLWFLGTLVPVIGIVQVGQQSMADRYTYLPSIGLFMGVIWTVCELSQKRALLKTLFAAGSILALIACMAVTKNQLQYWKNSEILYRHAIAVTHENSYAEYMLAFTLDNGTNFDESIRLYKDSLRIDPYFAAAENNMARDYAMQEKFSEATNHYAIAVTLMPTNATIHYNFAESLLRLKDVSGAISEYGAAISRDPSMIQAHYGLGLVLERQQQFDRAIGEMNEVLKLDPTNAAPHKILGDCFSEAGRLADAVREYKLYLDRDPTNVIVLNNLAWLRAACSNPALRDGHEAVSLSLKACELTQYREPMFIGTLADAYAETGDFEQAISLAQKARDLALSNGMKELAESNEKLLIQYRSHQAFHEPPPAQANTPP